MSEHPPCPCGHHDTGEDRSAGRRGLTRRHLLAGAAAAVAASAAGAWRHTGAVAAPVPPLPIESSAAVNRPARRLGVVRATTAASTTTSTSSTTSTTVAPALTFARGGLPFPMAAAPKCSILDNFGDARGGRTHEGIDILATGGQAVFAVADGTLTTRYVAGAANATLSGNAWTLTLPDRSYIFYAHLSSFATGLEVGSKVARGQVIGYVGDTGNPTAGNHHLHFEVHPASAGRSAVDPLPLLDVPNACTVS